VSPEEARDALWALQRLSLLSVDDSTAARGVRVHALVQRVVREHLPAARSEPAARAAADALLEVWPEHDTEPVMAQALRDCADALRGHAENVLWSPDGHPLLFRAGSSLGGVGLVNQAVTYWQQMAATSTGLLGPDHPHTLTTRHNLARWRGEAGDPAGAATACEQLLADCLRVLGPDHPDTLTARNNLARWRGEAGDAAGAVTACEQLLADCLRVLGPDHPHTLTARHNLADWRGEAGDAAGAATAFEQLLADRLRVLGPDHPHTLAARHNLARWRGRAGDAAGAATALEQLLADRLRVLGPDHPHTLATRHNLAFSTAAAPPGSEPAAEGSTVSGPGCPCRTPGRRRRPAP
jgi:hypothetical protein